MQMFAQISIDDIIDYNNIHTCIKIYYYENGFRHG